MSKFWLIAAHEYTRHVLRRRFLLPLFSVPLMIIVTIVLVIVVIMINSVPTPIGYIDQSGILANPKPGPAVKWPERNAPMKAYPDEASAKADLQAGKIQAYFVISADYLQSGKAKEVYLKEPKGMAIQQFDSFLTTNLLANQPPDVVKRIQEGSEITVQSADKNREASENQIVNIIMPIVAGILFIIGMMTSSGYLMQAVAEEKENRTMEIMVTSVSPTQLMSGKVVADIAVGVTQLVVWSLFIVLGLLIGKNFLPELSGFQISGEVVTTLALVMIPAFVMISGLMAAVGATVTEASEGQQVMGLFTIPIWIPYFFIGSFIDNPNSPLATALSIFPLTSPMTIAMRLSFTAIPIWEMVISVSILVLSAIGAVWLAGRAFRLGMLRYGQRLRWKEIFSQQKV
jgi:ABC-2 type transport system permease protein